MSSQSTDFSQDDLTKNSSNFIPEPGSNFSIPIEGASFFDQNSQTFVNLTFQSNQNIQQSKLSDKCKKKKKKRPCKSGIRLGKSSRKQPIPTLLGHSLFL